jgi:hypothetical protein
MKAYRDFKNGWRRHKDAGTLRSVHLFALRQTLRDLPFVVSFIAIFALGLWLVEKVALHENLHEWLTHITKSH